MEDQSLTESMILRRAQKQTLETVKRVNLWGLNIKNVSLLTQMPMLEVISLSSNNITQLSSFSNCIHLKELYLRNNQISELKEIEHLSKLPVLHTLFLLGNSCCYPPDTTHFDTSTLTAPYYRPTVVKHIHSLERLDMSLVSDEEKRAAGLTTEFPYSPMPLDGSGDALEATIVSLPLLDKNSSPAEEMETKSLEPVDTSKRAAFIEEMAFAIESPQKSDCGPFRHFSSSSSSSSCSSFSNGVEANRGGGGGGCETVESARKRISSLSLVTKQALMEILQILPKLNCDALILLGNEIANRRHLLEERARAV